MSEKINFPKFSNCKSNNSANDLTVKDLKILVYEVVYWVLTSVYMSLTWVQFSGGDWDVLEPFSILQKNNRMV